MSSLDWAGNITANSNPLRIGYSEWGEYFAGQIDEIRVDNTAHSTYGAVQTSSGKPAIITRPASGVTTGGAWLNGYLSSTGLSATTVFVYWGASDGGTNKNFWANTNKVADSASVGSLSNSVSLSPDSIYYYRHSASNAQGEVWAPLSGALITGGVTIEAP